MGVRSHGSSADLEWHWLRTELNSGRVLVPFIAPHSWQDTHSHTKGDLQMQAHLSACFWTVIRMPRNRGRGTAFTHGLLETNPKACRSAATCWTTVPRGRKVGESQDDSRGPWVTVAQKHLEHVHFFGLNVLLLSMFYFSVPPISVLQWQLGSADHLHVQHSAPHSTNLWVPNPELPNPEKPTCEHLKSTKWPGFGTIVWICLAPPPRAQTPFLGCYGDANANRLICFKLSTETN